MIFDNLKTIVKTLFVMSQSHLGTNDNKMITKIPKNPQKKR